MSLSFRALLHSSPERNAWTVLHTREVTKCKYISLNLTTPTTKQSINRRRTETGINAIFPSPHHTTPCTTYQEISQCLRKALSASPTVAVLSLHRSRITTPDSENAAWFSNNKASEWKPGTEKFGGRCRHSSQNHPWHCYGGAFFSQAAPILVRNGETHGSIHPLLSGRYQ